MILLHTSCIPKRRKVIFWTYKAGGVIKWENYWWQLLVLGWLILQGLGKKIRGKSIYMESYPIYIKQIFLQRLTTIGVEPNLISGLMKALAVFFYINPNMSLSQVNERLHFLGWNDIELDYHTYQLAIECFDKSRA